MNSAWARIRIALALGGVATVAAGCAAANNATSNQASGQTEQPYKTMYGITNEGTTTDLYSELFGSSQPQPAPTATVATTQPVQPVTAQPITPAQPGATAASPARPGQAASTTAPSRRQTAAANRAQQPASIQPPPVQVAQQPASPPPPPEPDVPTAYGITANGPSTDLYTAIFGPRQSNGQ